MTTETMKREMYEFLEVLKFAYRAIPKPLLFGYFDTALEKYLEALRQEISDLSALNTKGRNASLHDQVLLQNLREERDDLRNRLQAFVFANRAAGEQLRAANELIQRQRESIKELHATKDDRKSVPGTSPQRSEENSPSAVLEALPMLCQHSYQYMHDVPSGELRPRCIFCRVLLEK